MPSVDPKRPRATPASPAASPASPASPDAPAPAGERSSGIIDDIADVVTGFGGMLNPVYAARQSMAVISTVVTGRRLLEGAGAPLASLTPGEALESKLKLKARDGAVMAEGTIAMATERTREGFEVHGDVSFMAGAGAHSNDAAAEATAGVHVEVSYDADSADAAARASEKLVAVGSALGAAAPLLGPLSGAAAARSGVLDDARSVGVRVAGAAEAKVDLELAKGKLGDALPSADAAAKAGVKLASDASIAVRVERDDAGHKVAVVERRARLEVDGEAEVGGGTDELELALKQEAKVTAALVVADRFALPDDFPMTRALDPAQVLSAMSGPAEHAVSLEAEAAGSGQRVEARVEVESVADALSLGRSILRGDAGADDVRVKGEVRRFTENGMPLSGGAPGAWSLDADVARITPAGKPVSVDDAHGLATALTKASAVAALGAVTGYRVGR